MICDKKNLSFDTPSGANLSASITIYMNLWRKDMLKNIEPDFTAFENNIIDLIQEEQIKLGYQSETIRFYYPMESINSLLKTELNIDELKLVLDQFCIYVRDRLGKVTHSNKDNRFCMIIPPQGVTYVHSQIEDNHFLRELIMVISKHNCTMEDLVHVFKKYSDHVVVKEIQNGEFDYLLYFEEEQADAYRYCFKFDMGHAIYHRFTKQDYINNGF